MNILKNKDALLGLMLVSYLVPILYIYSSYSTNPSVSNNICHPNSQTIILSSMMLMGFFTILYEIERNDNISFLSMNFLLFGIYGVICIDEWNPLHYLFAGIILLSIMYFMINNHHNQQSDILTLLLVLQWIFLLLLLVNMELANFFIIEVIFILNFAFYYFYLHYLDKLETT